MKRRLVILGFVIIISGVLSIPAQAEELSNWNIISYMNEYREGCGVAVIQGYMYAIGGLYSSNDSVERAQVLPNGNLGSWEYVNKVNETGRNYFGTITANNSIYIFGGSSYAATNWGPLSLVTSIERAVINSDSTLGPWSILSSQLAVPRYGFAWAVYNNILYIIGGVTNIDGDSNLVEQGPINSDGSLGPFVLSTTVLPEAAEGLSAVVYKNYIVTAGGETGNGGYLGTTYIATIYSDGQLGAWAAFNGIIRPYCAAVTDGQYFYDIGGNPVERTQLYSNGSIGNWEDVNNLNIERAGLGAWMNFPYIYAVDGEGINGDLNSVERAMIIPTSVEKKYWELLY
jgi:hypothetical protein